ncbi:MAG TPA: MFS transporter [Candidatus Acidoferrales bacterium]|nr:MFS transporter [Candidatus Acidoferrales bacterium]
MAASIAVDPLLPPKPEHPLRNPFFRKWWIGASISLTGDQFYLVALPWVILQLTGSAVAMGSILMLAAVPRAVLMLLGGALSDRFSPRKIMMCTASARTLFVAAIGILLWAHQLHIWHLYLLAFAFGTADAFGAPAASTFLPSLVKKEQLLAANSVFQSTAQVTMIAAPAPAGLVIRAFGAVWAFLMDAVSFLFIIGALWQLPDPPQTSGTMKKPPVWRSILEGIGHVYRDVPLRSLMSLAAVINFCLAGPMSVGLAYLAKQRFGSPAAYGVLISSIAAGGLAGAFLAGVWKPQRRGVLMLSVATLLALGVGSVGLLHSLWAIAVVLVVMGVSAGLTNIQIVSWVQKRVEQAVRGRVMSVLMFLSLGLMPISLALAGVLAQWSLKGLFLLGSAALLLVTTAGAMQKTVRDIE